MAFLLCSQPGIGRTIRALGEKPLAGRSEADAPDVDAQIIFQKPAPVGEFIDVRITGTQIYDLVGEPISF